ncbi:triose-phosphate isomerase [Desulfothermus sp.]
MNYSFLHLKSLGTRLELINPEEPNLFRKLYPYKKVCRISFDDTFVLPRPAEPMIITDTTFRDGQQARPPYTVEQISKIFDFLHELGGRSGLIRQSEFFLYSKKDKRAVEECLAKEYRYPQITGWIRCNKEDLKLVKQMGLKETGMLTSVSDYHIYLKLGKDRKKAMEDYLEVIEMALELGIVPRCHFEDITRADIYGFCIPFAQKLMELSTQSGMPVKIRLCDTMGYGVPYAGAALPRNVGKIIRAFTDEAEVPGKWLEWHGHNDFHKALINASTAWLYGCSAANGTLLGFGERTGNAPIEALVIEYISITGDDDAANTHIISEIAEYFQKELKYNIPPNYPFVGRDFNATSAGIHVDGLAKNEEIYNIFDTKHILGREVPIIITDKSGRAGIAYWLNHHLKLTGDNKITKNHPAVGKIYKKIMEQYNKGRTTSMSHEEMMGLAKRYLPELFQSEFDYLKETAHRVAAKIINKLCEGITKLDKQSIQGKFNELLTNYPFIQFAYLTDQDGKLFTWVISHPEDRSKFKQLVEGEDQSDREWFKVPMQTGNMFITDFYRSVYTGKLCLTVSSPIFNEEGDIIGVFGADIRFEDLLKIHNELEEEEQEEE